MVRVLLTMLTLSALAATGVAADLALRLPVSVRRSVTLPRLGESCSRAPAGPVIEVALVKRDGMIRAYVNGAARNWAGTREHLARLARAKRLPVVAYVDRKTPFAPLEWLLAACAHRDVRLTDVRLAVRSRAGLRVTRAPRPHDPDAASEEDPRSVERLGLYRREGERTARLVYEREELGTGDTAYAALRREAGRFDWSPRATHELKIAPDVPHGEAVRLVAVLRSLKVGNLRFMLMQPPPAWAAPVWKIPASRRTGITLPAARTGEAYPTAAPLLEIAVLNRLNSYYADGSERTLERLEQNLVAHSHDRRDRSNELRLSRLPVLVLADAQQNWWYVQAILKACAEPHVRIPGVHLAVLENGVTKIIPIRLPARPDPEDTAFLRVRLDGAKGKPTTVAMKSGVVGTGDEGFRRLAATIASIRKRYPKAAIVGRVDSARFLPYGDVVRAVDAFRAAGIKELRFLQH